MMINESMQSILEEVNLAEKDSLTYALLMIVAELKELNRLVYNRGLDLYGI